MSFKLSSTAVIFESGGSSILVADSFTYTQLRPGYDSAQNIDSNYITDFFPSVNFFVTPPNEYQGSAFGFIAGGGPYPPYENQQIIHKFPFASDANSADTGGDLRLFKNSSSGSSSPTHGYIAGGYQGPAAFPNPSSGATNGAIDKFPFAISSGISTDVGDQVTNTNVPVGASSDTHGYSIAGLSYGFGPSLLSDVEKYSHSSDGNATKIGDLIDDRWNHASNSSRNDGVAFVSGGFDTPPSSGGLSDTIQKFPFASDNDAVDTGANIIGGLYTTYGVSGATGTVSKTHAYIAGGGPPYLFQVNMIQKFPFSISSGTSTDVGDLFYGRANLSGISSTTHGYATGGEATPNPPAPYPYDGVNTIQKWSIASDANGTDVGDMIHPANNHPDPGHQV